MKAAPPQSQARSAAARCVQHGQRRWTVVERLLADIFQGRLKAGEHLVIQNLARRFGMSPTPIREALVALEGVGIVDIQPNRGAVVRRVTEVDVKEVCQVRRALECTAVRLACGRIELEELHELADAFRARAEKPRPSAAANGANGRESLQGDVEQARELDSRLHDLIAESCGNRYLSRELGRLKLLFRTFRDVAWDRRATKDRLRFSEEAREHLAIVEALIANDAAAASRAMAAHIRSGVKYWSRGLPTS
ncbi:MAG: GntR family transcriptional regulator [Pirellulaceae bacterium]